MMSGLCSCDVAARLTVSVDAQLWFLTIQGDQLNIAVFFWYLVNSNLSSVTVHVYRSLH